jgi:quercetin dioxygenase-like cupin family protein
MKKTRAWAALAVAVAAAGAGASTVLATTQAGVTTTTVGTASLPPLQIHSYFRPQQQTWPPSVWSALLQTHGITDLYVVDNVIAPGGTTGWHTHAGPSVIIVKSGTVTNYRAEARRCAGVDYPAGSAFVDAGGNDIHELKNNTDQPVETVAIQFIPHGQPRKTDLPEVPPGCQP